MKNGDLVKKPGKIEVYQNRKDETRKDDGVEEGNWLKDRNTEDSVTLRGRGCNNPLTYPRLFCNYECLFYLLLVRISTPRPHHKQNLAAYMS